MSDSEIDLSKQPLVVRVLSPARTLYSGNAVSVTGTNKVGQFDVLAGHANLFSILIGPDIRINTGGDVLTFPMVQGLIKVSKNNVTIFTDINIAANASKDQRGM